MKIIVTGGNGQLGRSLKRLTVASRDQYIFTDVEELDITSADAVRAMFRCEAPDVVINCAAYTDVDRAEAEESAAALINAEAPAILAREAARCGAFLIHVSTDYVFGGNTGNTPRNENEPANPTGAYGRTKLAGERAITSSDVNYAIVRTAWLYSEYGHNFLKTMLRLTADKEHLNVVFDQCGTPTYAGNLAAAILRIVTDPMARREREIYHFTDEGVCSWYDFAEAIRLLAGHDGCRIAPCHSSEFPSAVERPPFSVLDKTKIKRRFGLQIPHWHASLITCIGNINETENGKTV